MAAIYGNDGELWAQDPEGFQLYNNYTHEVEDPMTGETKSFDFNEFECLKAAANGDAKGGMGEAGIRLCNEKYVLINNGRIGETDDGMLYVNLARKNGGGVTVVITNK